LIQKFWAGLLEIVKMAEEQVLEIKGESISFATVQDIVVQISQALLYQNGAVGACKLRFG
jgi:hypothetical protein